jgi:hypothetical protein
LSNLGYLIELWSIGHLRANPRNYRAHPPEQIEVLRQNIRRHGLEKPIVVAEDGTILAGHGILEAARLEGYEQVPVHIYHGGDAEAFLIDDNGSDRLAQDDERILVQLLRERQSAGTLGSTGWTDDDLREMMARLDMLDEGLPADPGAGEPPAHAVTHRGEVWVMGRHRLICGDSRDARVMETILAGERAALCVTSPPYGVGKEYEEKGITPWFETVRPVIQNLARFAEIVVWQIGDLYTTGSQFIEPTMAHSAQIFLDAGMRPIWTRIWEKQGMNFGIGPYHLVSNKPVQQYEYLAAFASALAEDAGGEVPEIREYGFVCAFAGAQYRFLRRLTQAERRAWGYAGIWRINTVVENKEHPAMFPLEIPERCIRMHSDPDNLVLEPFSGAGTTIIAAERQGRRCCAVELSPAYCDVAVDRWQRMTGLQAQLEGNGALFDERRQRDGAAAASGAFGGREGG